MKELYKDLKIDFMFENEKGKLLQLVHEGYAQVNVLTSLKGTARGGHYHKNAEEAFYIISGAVNVELYYQDEMISKTFVENDFFLIHKNVVHEMFFLEDTMMVALYTKPIESEGGEKDIIIV